MAKRRFDYQGAIDEGYSDEEITPFLLEQHPQFDYQSAQQEGYSPQEINEFLSTYKPEKSTLEKAGRTAAQYGLGLAENALLPYELGVAPLASKEAQMVPYRENLFEDIERLQEQKQMGQWDEQDQALYDNLLQQAKDPSKSEQFIQTADLGIRGLAEQATGLELQPQGVLEHAANWTGFIKNPKKLAQMGMTVPNVIKSIVPSGSEVFRGLGAGIALEMAEEGDFGPWGRIAATLVGDLGASSIAGAAKKAKDFVKNPKQSLANLAAMFTPKQDKELQKQIIQEFRDAGLTADIGTITNSNSLKGLQAKLAQSSLTGKALDDLRQTMTNEIKEEYKVLADGLGEAKYSTLHEASEEGKTYLTNIRNEEKTRISDMYNRARERLNESSTVRPLKLSEAVNKYERDLLPGGVKSSEQKAVLEVLEKLKADIESPTGKVKETKIQDLMNNKIALNDIINFEVQGGQKQLLKQIVHEIDEAIISYGKKDLNFLKDYSRANKQFAEHAKTFRNDNINRILTSQDPQVLMNKMNSVQGLREIEKALSKSPQGKEVFGNLKRLKFDNMIGKKMTDNVSEQLKMGTFSNLLKNPKDAQIIKEILGPESFAKLEKLQKNVGKLAQTAQKFFNASKSGVTLIDAAAIGKVMSDMASLLMLNPWPLMKTGASLGSARYLSKLFSDTSFLKLVEEAVMASEKNDISKLLKIAQQMEPAIKKAMLENSQSQ